MTAIDVSASFVILALLGTIAVFFVAGVRALYREAHPDVMALCAPSRRASITANTTPAPRRIVAQLGRIDATYTVPFPLPAVVATSRTSAAVAEYAVPRPIDVDAIRANSRTYRRDELTPPDAPPAPVQVAPPVEVQPQGIPVVDWPTRIVQPVPLSRR